MVSLRIVVVFRLFVFIVMVFDVIIFDVFWMLKL